MGRLLLFLASSLFLVALGASVNAQTTAYWPLFAIATACAAIGWGITTRWAQEHIPGLSTPATRYRKVYDGLQAVRRGIREAKAEGRPFGRDAWEQPLREWDREFWAFIRKDFYTRETSIEVGHTRLEAHLAARFSDDTAWADGTVGWLLARRTLLESLEPDLDRK